MSLKKHLKNLNEAKIFEKNELLPDGDYWVTLCCQSTDQESDFFLKADSRLIRIIDVCTYKDLKKICLESYIKIKKYHELHRPIDNDYFDIGIIERLEIGMYEILTENKLEDLRGFKMSCSKNDVIEKIEKSVCAFMITEHDGGKLANDVLKSIQYSGLSQMVITRMLHLADRHNFIDDNSKKLYAEAMMALFQYKRENWENES